MVSYAPFTQSYLFNHMSFFMDYASENEPKKCSNQGSIYDFINSNPNFSKFKQIVDTAKMDGFLNGEQATCTIFISSNNYLERLPQEFFDTMDDGLARQIIASSTIPKILAADLITSSPVSYFYTKNPKMRMYTTNISSRTRLNNCANIVQYDIWCTNGIIHLIDNLIQPSEDHFMN